MAQLQFAQLTQVRSSPTAFTRVMVAQPEQERFELLAAAALIAHRIGFESDFPRKEFTTTAPFEAFPTGELVALSERKDFALPLKQLFKSQLIKAVSIDIGIYDRMVGGNPEFVYVRNIWEAV